MSQCDDLLGLTSNIQSCHTCDYTDLIIDAEHGIAVLRSD